MSVIAFAKNWEGKFKNSSYELVSYTKELANRMNTRAIVVSIGQVDESELMVLGEYGADRIITVEDERLNYLNSRVYAEVIAQVARKESARVVVLTDNNSGKGISPRLSVQLKAGLASSVLDIPLSLDPFVVKKKVFSGKAYAHVRMDSEVKILSIAKNCFGRVKNSNQASIEKFILSISSDPRVKTARALHCFQCR
jgi:electron transfer flavoprotein alpha subunit